MSVRASAELVHRCDPDRFLAAMACPPDARRILFPIYAFNIEVSRAPWVTEEPIIAEMRLRFWRDVAEDIGASRPPRAHETAQSLATAVRPGDAPLLDGIAAARQWDIHKDPFADRAQFDAYIDGSAGNLAWLAARALGAPGAAEAAVRAFARGAGLAAYLRAVPALKARGRRPLIDEGPQAIRDLADEGLAALARARADRARVPVRAGYALYAGWRAEGHLKAVRADPGRVLEGGLDESEFVKRARLLRLSLTGRW